MMMVTIIFILGIMLLGIILIFSLLKVAHDIDADNMYGEGYCILHEEMN